MRPFAARLLIVGLGVLVCFGLTARIAFADCTEGVCVRDDFLARIMSGSSGNMTWSSNWIETGDTGNSSSGDILIQTLGSPNYLEFNGGSSTNYSWARCVGSFPVDAQSNSLYIETAIWSDVSIGGIPPDADRIRIEYAVAVPSTSCGTDPPDTWLSIASSNSDRAGWDPIVVQLPDSLRGNHFWVRLRMENVLENADFHRFDFIEVRYLSPLAVEIDDFAAIQQGHAISVTWQTVSELGARGYNLYRANDPAAPLTRLNAQLIPSQSAGSPNGHDYSWLDSDNLTVGSNYYYWVEAVDTGGSGTMVGPVAATYSVPAAIALRGGQSAGTTGWGGITLLALLLATGALRRVRPALHHHRQRSPLP